MKYSLFAAPALCFLNRIKWPHWPLCVLKGKATSLGLIYGLSISSKNRQILLPFLLSEHVSRIKQFSGYVSKDMAVMKLIVDLLKGRSGVEHICPLRAGACSTVGVANCDPCRVCLFLWTECGFLLVTILSLITQIFYD